MLWLNQLTKAFPLWQLLKKLEMVREYIILTSIRYLRFFKAEDETVVPITPITPVIVLPESTEQATVPKSDFTVSVIIKSLIHFLANRQNIPLWNYEDITAKVWIIKSAEQIDIFLQYILKVFQVSLPTAHINERWAQTALQLGLSCSSRHYAGRSLQIFRSLRVPITSRMLSDILSRLVETVAEQGEDMQGKYFEKYIVSLNLIIVEVVY